MDNGATPSPFALALLSSSVLLSHLGIRAVYSTAGSQFQLNDTASYFFDSLDRFIPPDYIPSVDDVLRVRVRSTGIEEAMFCFDKMIFKVLWLYWFDFSIEC